MKRFIVHWLAVILPDNCPLQRHFKLFGRDIVITPCKLNPFYEDVIDEKMRMLGY